ncbi:site-2 protease family protein [Bacillus sp. FJAT-49736]|uniref:site-2 protease family protein n=1 Tax=Bacillus sp. FJAT-49736 TaxID=2833582 RepID=UPI001BC9C55F|nr:site-2 protease family protein [Bacillus sp. FJAT-49736]MBS4174217.1 site-2 protease family protein [Bacillus sp. FJAT-49736]
MKNRKSILGVIGGALLVLLSKLKYLIVVLKIAKLHTLISLLISVGAYTLLYGWKFGVGLVYLLFIHEMGHMVAARQKGVPTTAAVFIPFIGAAVGIKEKPKSIKDDVYISFMGPVAGLLSILPFFVLYYMTHELFWLALFQVGAMINLFNLIPMMPLDGGRIAKMLSKKLIIIGLVVIAIAAIISPDPILILLVIFGIFQVFAMKSEDRREKYFLNQSLEWKERIQEWEKLKTEYMNLPDDAEKLAWLNGVIYEYKGILHSTNNALSGKRDQKSEAIYEARMHAYRMIVSQLESLYDGDLAQEPIYSAQAEVEQQLQKIHFYKNTTKKDKLIVFIFYLLLILILSGCMVYSLQTLDLDQARQVFR